MKLIYKSAALCICTLLALSGCGNTDVIPSDVKKSEDETHEQIVRNDIEAAEVTVNGIDTSGNNILNTADTAMNLTDIEFPEDGSMKKISDGLYAAMIDDDGFERFLDEGGASEDRDILSYLQKYYTDGNPLEMIGKMFGCSTIMAEDSDGKHHFGRNFDWYDCDALILKDVPQNGYASLSTVNMDFISQATGIPLPDKVKVMASVFAPLDGMNEKGLMISVNMIEDSDTINQNTELPDLTTTTMIRLLLNKAADVEEAVELLQSHDFHASFGYMVHFHISDSSGKAVAAEYINNELHITPTSVLTNYYVTEGEKYGIGTSQSKERYTILSDTLSEKTKMNEADVMDALESVNKSHYNDGETTEWSVIYTPEDRTEIFFHEEDYSRGWKVTL